MILHWCLLTVLFLFAARFFYKLKWNEYPSLFLASVVMIAALWMLRKGPTEEGTLCLMLAFAIGGLRYLWHELCDWMRAHGYMKDHRYVERRKSNVHRLESDEGDFTRAIRSVQRKTA